jgi:hypothetical protein
VQSKLFDALTLLLIAVLRHDRGDRQGVSSMRDQLLRYRERFPLSRRLARFVLAAEVLVELVHSRQDAALTALGGFSDQVGDDDFDLEAANTTLMLWARLPEACRADARYEALLDRIAMRFCVSKAIAEVLMASAQRAAPAMAVVRRCQARVAALAEQAMDRSLKGEADGAVRLLLKAGTESLNAKLLELAVLLARRHREQLPEADALSEQAAAVMSRSCRTVTHIAGIQRSGRSPGGLQLRARTSTELAHATA